MSIDSSADIVEIIIRLAQAQGLDADAAHLIEMQVRTEYGGCRVHIPKKKKHPTPEQRQKIYEAGVSNAPTPEITSAYRIDRSTLYRYMKRGPK